MGGNCTYCFHHGMFAVSYKRNLFIKPIKYSIEINKTIFYSEIDQHPVVCKTNRRYIIALLPI